MSAGTPIAHDHRHLLHLSERRILCACEVCLAEKSAEAEYRPVGHRITWLDDLQMADEMWARLGIPIALAFFTQNGDTGETVAFYPSPAGSTECELDLDAWATSSRPTRSSAELEPDAEAFIVNRMSDPPQYVIVPIDRCYEMVGAVKVAWEGISGGDEVDQAIAAFFTRLQEEHMTEARGLTAGPQAQVPAAGDNGGLTPQSPPDSAEPEFKVVSAEPVARSVEPALSFKGTITDASQRPVYLIALTAIVVVEPGKRSYAPGERERLMELFGGPERWASTTGAFRWAATSAMVHGFTGEGEFELVVPVSYDLEIASAKYFGALDEGGTVPLRFHFNGSILYERGDGRVQTTPVPWDRSERFEMPMEAWTTAHRRAPPLRNWVPLHSETVSRIEDLKAKMGAPTFDDAVTRIIDRAEQGGTEDL